jgi:hypothetical protein
MRQIEDKLSLFVKDQFPAFYNEEGGMFQIFLEAYYEYLEQEKNTLDYSRNLLEYIDIDKTTDEFLEHYKATFLSQLPGLVKADDRLTIKNIMDFYRAKGTPRAVQLLFRLLFDESISVSYPSEDVLKPSTSDFKLPRYIEVYTGNIDKLIPLEGLEIIGATSGAKAFVETISTKILNKVKVHVLSLSNLRGNFLRGEVIAKSSDGIQDDMPIVTGSLSAVNITLGGSNNAVGDTFNIVASSGQQGRARVTAISDATGLVNFALANGGFGFSKDANVTFTDVNDQNLQVNNVINAAQTYSNTFSGNTHANGDLNVAAPYDSIIYKIDEAGFLRFETVEQKMEKLSVLSAATFNNDISAYLAANDESHWTYATASADSNKTPLIQGKDSGGNIIANGYLINTNIGTGTNDLTIALISGSFGNQSTSTINLASNTHTFETNEGVDEENAVTLTITDTVGSFSAGDVVKGDESGANGIVVSVNATTMVLNGSFGVWTSNDNVQDVTSGLANTANVTNIDITTSGANGVVSTANTLQIVINEVVGVFNDDKKIKGRRTNAIAITNTVSITGTSDVRLLGNNNSNAVADVYSNASITAQVIGSNATNIGFKTTRYSNGTIGTFSNNKAAFIRGRDSNTYANIVSVGSGSGADFKIGTLENEDPITIYTDFIGGNNVSNVSYLDCLIDGGNSGIGFLDNVTFTAGSGYSAGQEILFTDGGPGGGVPTTNAVANISSVGAGGTITGVTVVNQGAGFYTAATATMPNYSNGDVNDSATVTGNFDFGYGFPKDQDGDYTTILDKVLTRISGNVGTISSFSDINPGNNYNFDPFVSVYSPGIARYNRKDLVLNLTGMNTTSAGEYINFIIGETINQTVTFQSQVLTASGGFTLSFSNGASNAPASNTQIEELIGTSAIQTVNSTVTILGDITTGNSTSVTVKNLRTRTQDGNTFTLDTSNATPFTAAAITFGDPGQGDANISSIAATVTGLGTVSLSAVAKGQVYKFNNNNDGTGDVGIRRLSFSVGFNDTGTIQGASSGAGGTIDSLYEDVATRPIGDNANVVADARAANGVVTEVEVIDSGFGYQHSANLTLRSDNSNNKIVVSGTANVTTTGIGPGYWASKESFLNTKYIHDNDFYQSHSYVIESGLSLNKYRDILLKTTHIAGTRLFGRVFKESIANVSVTFSNTQLQRIGSSNGDILQTVDT